MCEGWRNVSVPLCIKCLDCCPQPIRALAYQRRTKILLPGRLVVSRPTPTEMRPIKLLSAAASLAHSDMLGVQLCIPLAGATCHQHTGSGACCAKSGAYHVGGEVTHSSDAGLGFGCLGRLIEVARQPRSEGVRTGRECKAVGCIDGCHMVGAKHL